MIKICLHCDHQFETSDRRRKFCSRSCAATYNNTGVRRHGKKPPDCLVCGTPLRDSSLKFCSQECHKKYKRKAKIQAWLHGEINPNGNGRVYKLSITIRQYLIEQGDGTCSECGYRDIHPITGEFIIDIDHIDGDRSNCVPSNLRLLCPNCHRKTETYGRIGGRVHTDPRSQKINAYNGLSSNG